MSMETGVHGYYMVNASIPYLERRMKRTETQRQNKTNPAKPLAPYHPELYLLHCGIYYCLVGSSNKFVRGRDGSKPRGLNY